MSRTAKSRPFPALSASPEVWGLSLDVGAMKLNLKDWEGSGSQISQLLCLFTATLLWKLRVSTSISEHESHQLPEEQWGHLKSRESLGYEPYKTQGYRHIYKYVGKKKKVCFFFSTIPTNISWIFHNKDARNKTIPLKTMRIWQWGFSGKGPLLILLQRRQDPSPEGQVGSGIHLPVGLPSHAWKPCSSTVFLTLASSLGSRNICSTHTHSGHCSAQEGGWASPWRTPQKQCLPLLTFAALGREVEAALPGSGHSSQARQARPGTIKHWNVVSEHRLYLYNHCTAIVLYGLQPST